MVEELNAMVEHVIRARLSTATKAMDEALQCVQRKRDQQLADMANLASLVAHLKAQLESKAQACMDAMDETMASVTTTLHLKVQEVNAQGRTLDLTVERALNERRQRVAEVNEGSLCLQSELEKQAAEWNEVLDRTMAGITAQLNSKVTSVLAQLDKAQEQEIRNEGEEAKSTTHAGRGSDKEEQRQLDRQVTLNVGGRTFKTFQSTLQQYPDTLLGAMFSERNQALVRHSTEYFFDRNGDLFASILDFYRHGALVAPQTIDKDLWQRELDYWHLPHMAEEPQKVPEMLHKVVSALNQGYHKTVKTHQTLITRACQELSTNLDAELGTGELAPLADGQKWKLPFHLCSQFAKADWHQAAPTRRPFVGAEFLPQLEALTLTTQALIKTEISRRLAAEHGVTIQIGEKVGLATSRSPIYQSFVWVPHGCPPISP